jgi:K+-transporting ATPase ATPase A chain
VNSAMPFENPTTFANFVEMLFILLIPAALTATFGRMVGNRRQGWALYAAMAAMLVAGVGVTYAAEQHGSPAERAAEVSGPNMEGKEQRFGIANSALWATVTTDASNGYVFMGQPHAGRGLRRFGESLPEALMRRLPGVDVRMVADPPD